MKKISVLIFVVLAQYLSVNPTAAQSGNTTAFVNVLVIPMDTERVLEGYTVIVKDGAIASMGPAEEMSIPETAKIIV